MRRQIAPAGLIALAAAALAACTTTSAYAPSASYKAPPPMAAPQPKYPIQSAPSPSASADPASAPAPAPAPTVADPPPAAVESAQLPPPTAQPEPAPPPQAQATPAPQPQAQYVPPPPLERRAVVRTEPGRLIAGGRVVAATGMFRDYAVEKKDHVDAIARDLGTTRQVIVQANHLKAPYRLSPGEHLRVPVDKAYVAESGDTLAEVAKRFDLSAADLASLNGLSERGRLRGGERIALPASYHDRGPTRGKPTTVTQYVTVPAPRVATTAPTYRVTPPAARPTVTATARPTPAPAPAPIYAAAPAPKPTVQAYAPPPARQTYTPPARTYAPAPTPTVQAAAPPPAKPAYTPPVRTYAPAPAPSVQAYAAPPRPAYAGPSTPNGVEAETPIADLAAMARGRFIWPLRGEIISQFGIKGVGRRNDGVDIRARQGTIVLAAAGGNVVYAGDQVPGFGNLVLVKHPDGWVTAYAHMDKIAVQMRQEITQGQEIGQVGETGGVTEPELHFEVRYAATPTDRAKPVDPQLVLPR